MQFQEIIMPHDNAYCTVIRGPAHRPLDTTVILIDQLNIRLKIIDRVILISKTTQIYLIENPTYPGPFSRYKKASTAN